MVIAFLIPFELRVHATLLCIDPGEQAGSGWEALGGVVHVRETKAWPILCQSVEMGCIHLAAVATDIGKAHVVETGHAGKDTMNTKILEIGKCDQWFYEDESGDSGVVLGSEIVKQISSFS